MVIGSLDQGRATISTGKVLREEQALYAYQGPLAQGLSQDCNQGTSWFRGLFKTIPGGEYASKISLMSLLLVESVLHWFMG